MTPMMSASLIARARKIRLIAFDVDGVMTTAPCFWPTTVRNTRASIRSTDTA